MAEPNPDPKKCQLIKFVQPKLTSPKAIDVAAYHSLPIAETASAVPARTASYKHPKIDVEAYRTSQSQPPIDGGGGFNVTVDKPPKSRFFVVADPGDDRLVLPVICDSHDSVSKWWLLAPDLEPHFFNDGLFRRINIYVCLTEAGQLYLWPVPTGKSIQPYDTWTPSAHAVAREAMHHWVRLESDSTAKRYVAKHPVGELAPPEWSRVPSVNDLLSLGFSDTYVDSLAHTKAVQLLGGIANG